MLAGSESETDEEDQTNAMIHQNQPYDESLEVPDAEEVASTYSPTPRAIQGHDRGKSRGSTPPDSRFSVEEDESDEFEDVKNQQMPLSSQIPGKVPKPGMKNAGLQQQQFNSEEEEEESGSESTDDDDDDDDDHVTLEGAYDPTEYENLEATPEIKELFQYITRYTPQSIELEHRLRPFIPDYIPAVGDIDAFIKINRPDNKPDTLGLTVLDEPCAKQSDPTVLDLQLRAISKQNTDKKLVVKSLPEAEKNPKQIDLWMENIRELHRSKPPPNVHYSKNMPDIDTLMQEWPPEFEELLKEVGLPTAELDCDLGQYVELVCSILDIPIYKNATHHNEKTQALHVLFTLYSEFKNSQHFQGLAEENALDNAVKQSNSMGDQEPDRFVL